MTISCDESAEERCCFCFELIVLDDIEEFSIRRWAGMGWTKCASGVGCGVFLISGISSKKATFWHRCRHLKNACHRREKNDCCTNDNLQSYSTGTSLFLRQAFSRSSNNSHLPYPHNLSSAIALHYFSFPL